METKRVSDQYKISSPQIVLDGNLTVIGSTTTVSTVNSTIQDNIITLNKGEFGVGVTENFAGIEVDRGSADLAIFRFNETTDAWEAKIGNSFTVIQSATPVNANDVTTKSYVDAGIAAGNPGGPFGSVQFNDNTAFNGSADFVWNGSAIILGQSLTIGSNDIGLAATDQTLTISANGQGKIFFRNVLQLENETGDPTSEADSNLFYAKTPGSAGSGLYFKNTSTSDELVSRTRAILFGLIF